MAEQRIALVTGGNRGIGLEICRQLAKAGIRVLLGSRDSAKGAAAAAELIAAKLPVEVTRLDVANDQSIIECMNWIRRDVNADIRQQCGIMVEDADDAPEEEIRSFAKPCDQRLRSLLLSRSPSRS